MSTLTGSRGYWPELEEDIGWEPRRVPIREQFKYKGRTGSKSHPARTESYAVAAATSVK